MIKRVLGVTAVPGWMVTFADLMALMMTFFVLLYSFSSQDEAKYKQVVDSMALGFGAQTIEWPQVDPGASGPQPGSLQLPDPSLMPAEPAAADAQETPVLDSTAAVRVTAEVDRFSLDLAEDIELGMLSIESQGNEIVIRFPEQATFPPGSAELNTAIYPSLSRIADLLQDVNGEIWVAGHTDDRPIHTARFRSNWELSAARAVSMVHGLLQQGIAVPEAHLNIAGHAATQPLVVNDSDANRAINRRVEISILVKDAGLTAD